MRAGFLVLPHPAVRPGSDPEEAPGSTTGKTCSPIPTFSKFPSAVSMGHSAEVSLSKNAGALPGLREDPGTFGAGRGTQEPGVKRHNQDLVNILIAALAPLAPRPGHTCIHSVWKQRSSRGEECRKGAKQTYFNNAKNNRVNIPLFGSPSLGWW